MGMRAAWGVLACLVALPAAAQTVVVLPFEHLEREPRLDWLSEGLAQLTADRLAGPGRTVLPREEWQAALERLGLPAGARLSRATVLRAAEAVEVDQIIFGSYRSEGDALVLSAQVLRRDPPALSPPVEAAGPLAALMETHARLLAGILPFLEETGSGPAEMPEWPARRLDAFESYVRGLLALEPDQKLRLLREAARMEPNWMLPVFALGQSYFERRDCANALIWLSRIPPAHDRGYEAGFYAGVCHLLRDDVPRAEAAFTALRERGTAPETLSNLAVLHARAGEWMEAGEGWAEAAELDPAEPTYWFNYALALVRTGRPAAAVGPLHEVLVLRPADDEARALLVLALEASGRSEEAAAERAAAPENLPELKAEELAQHARVQVRLKLSPTRRAWGEAAGVARAEEVGR